MNRFLFISALVINFLSGCNNSANKPPEGNGGKDALATVNSAAFSLLGSYVGPFGDNKITLLITKVSADTVEGSSVVGGNDRPFTGVVKFINDKYNIVAKEPGDDQYDGVFNFTIDTKQPDQIMGSWKPNKPTETLKPKDYSLQRRSFVYLQDVGQYPMASKRLLGDSDVNNLNKPDLETMRNEIFARHGYCFRKKALRDMFEDKDWYIPHTVDVKADLTEIEKKNILLIKKFEKYAAEFGDDFGR